MTILVVVLLISCVFICRGAMREYKKMIRLTEPVYPQQNVNARITTINSNDQIPVVRGVEVYGLDRNIQIITITEEAID